MTTPIFQIPPVTPQDWLILNLFGIAALSALVVLVLPRAPTPRTVFLQLRAALGLTALHPTIIAFATLLWAAMVVFLIGGVMWTIGHILTALPKASDQAEALRGLFGSLTAMGATLVGIIAAPFTLIRIRQSQKANDLTDERLFNDKLNEASKNLAAWRDVTTVLGTGDERKTITTREPDLITRAAAIDRLHGLVEERPSEAERIARLLSLYVREHTVKVGGKEPDVPAEEPPEGASPQELQDWTAALRPKRSDLEHAVQTLGKLRNIKGATLSDWAINLDEANLQGMKLRHLNFESCSLRRTRLEGANLSSSNFQDSDFSYANLMGSKLEMTSLQNAYFPEANLQASRLENTDLNEAIFYKAQLSGVFAYQVKLDGAHLTQCSLAGALLIRPRIKSKAIVLFSDVTGAAVIDASSEFVTNLHFYFPEAIFGDGSTKVSPWPVHWPREDLDYSDFIRAWRKWVAANHPEVLQYLPKDPRE